MDSGYVLEVVAPEFADGLAMEGEGRRGVKDSVVCVLIPADGHLSPFFPLTEAAPTNMHVLTSFLG